MPKDRRASSAYRHIVDLMRGAGADNLQWVWHASWDDVPETHWNRLENYFPGPDYCAWLAVSAYGPLTPRTPHGLEGFRHEIDQVYPCLTNWRRASRSSWPSSAAIIHHRK